MVDRAALRSIYSFANVKNAIQRGSLEELGRSLEGQLEYQAFSKNVIKSEWFSTRDYILATKFGYETMTMEASGDSLPRKKRVKEREDREVATRFVPNDFPYYYTKDCGQFVLWKLNGDLEVADIFHAVEDLQKEKTIRDFTYYINPPHLKSVADVDHAHIVVQWPTECTKDLDVVAKSEV